MDRAKRECIVVAACKAFARFGFKKASVDEIAREAGVAKGTVYLAAENKEDLLYQAVLHELRAWNAEMSKLIDPRKDALELLSELATTGLQSMPKRPLIKQLFEGELHALLPRWQGRFDELTRMGRTNTIEVLKLGIAQGRFRADLDAEETAVLLMDMQISTLLFHNRETPDREERLGRRLVAAIALIERGLTRDAADPAGRPAAKAGKVRGADPEDGPVASAKGHHRPRVST